jgi:hypothetical protein
LQIPDLIDAKMSTFILRAALAILVLSGAMPCLAEPLLRAERPSVKVGDTKVFRDLNIRTGEKRDTSFVVTMIDANKIVMEMSGSTSGTRTFTREFNLVETKTGELITFTANPFWAYLRFPLEVGQKWDIPFEAKVIAQRANRNGKWQWKARVVDAEAVTVAAGTFQAFKIEYDGSYIMRQGSQSWSGTHKETAWYAPRLNSIVKRDYEQSAPSRNFLEHHVIELMSFRPAP